VIILARSHLPISSRKRGQVSIEYLLLFAAFFAVLGISLPVLGYSVDAFLISSDVLLAKKISSDLTESISLFSHLSNGSSKTISYFAAKEIKFYENGANLVVSAGEKSFEIELGGAKLASGGSYSRAFEVKLTKLGDLVELEINGLS
jgi:uncharacterized protein (UPF0333 family)